MLKEKVLLNTNCILIGVIFVLLALSACSSTEIKDSKDSDIEVNNSAKASCDATTMLGFCYDYVGPGWTSEKIELDCGFVEDNLLQSEPCSQETVVATCTFDLQGDPDLAIVYYFYEPMELSEAERMCPGTLFPTE